MGGDAVKAKRYRERAGELHKIAEDLASGNTKRMILSLALEYERLARLLDEAAVSDDPISLLAAFKKPDNPS